METDLFQRINELILLTNQKIAEGLSDGTLMYYQRIINKVTVDKFNYDSNGFITYHSTIQSILKNSGFEIDGRERIKESVLRSKEYLSALDSLNIIYKDFNNVNHLDMFVSQIIRLIETNSTLTPSKIDFLTKTFIKELNNEPVKYGATVELEGIIMMIDKLDIAEGVILRRPEAKDIEGEFFYNDPLPLINPSAILNIEILGKGAGADLQKYVEKVISLLKLFKIGSVDKIKYKSYSDSILSFQGSISSGFRKLNLEKYSLSNKDKDKLMEFWNKFFNILPEGFYGFNSSKMDYLTIAFNRYTDSLLNDIPEERVANAVMGLEAIFLNNEGELKYKLSKRISKIMGLLGCNAITIDQTVMEAYKIRSKFVHGDHLEANKIIELEKIFRGENKRNGEKIFNILDNDETMSDFIRKIIELLRVSIILITLQRDGENYSKNKMKKDFINLIDNSLIDKEKEEELKRLLLTLSENITIIEL